MKKVVICQHRLLHYRLGLFERLREVCRRRGIDLHLVHGQASRREATKKDEGSLPWAQPVINRFWEVGSRDLVWQPLPAELRDADLVVVMQENRILSNYPLLLSRLWARRRVAFWGHGVNFQSDSPTGLREKWKRFLLARVDWWFAYTQATVDILKGAGYPRERITGLDNAIDNDRFQQDLASVSEDFLTRFRDEIGADAKSRVGLFCGSLYADKRLAYMLAAADRIHSELPDFRLVVIGDGPNAGELRAAAQTRAWMRCVGVRKGLEKAAYFRLADVIFNPGAVGLHVLDAFYAGVPMATTMEARHGPEFAYLRDGDNCVVTSGGEDIYAQRIVRLLTDPSEYRRLCHGARQSAARYTLDNMVNRFADGIQKCLAQ